MCFPFTWSPYSRRGVEIYEISKFKLLEAPEMLPSEKSFRQIQSVYTGPCFAIP